MMSQVKIGNFDANFHHFSPVFNEILLFFCPTDRNPALGVADV